MQKAGRQVSRPRKAESWGPAHSLAAIAIDWLRLVCQSRCVLWLRGRSSQCNSIRLIKWFCLAVRVVPADTADTSCWRLSVSLARHPAGLQFVDRYVSIAAGPAKWSKLVEFLKTTYPRITADLVNRQQNQVGASALL